MKHLNARLEKFIPFLYCIIIAIVSSAAQARSLDTPQTPETALQTLRNGNALYVANIVELVNDPAALRRNLSAYGQHPIAAVVACADSRVPVESIFQQAPGQLFVIRTAGNTAGVQTAGSLQYGVEHLDVPLIVVLGHTRCGAVQAVVKGEEAHGSLAKMLEPIQGVSMAVESLCGLRGMEAESAVMKINVATAMQSLVDNVPEIANRIRSGKTKVVGAIYNIESGAVTWL